MKKAKDHSDINSYEAQLPNALAPTIPLEAQVSDNQQGMSKLHALHTLQSQMIENYQVNEEVARDIETDDIGLGTDVNRILSTTPRRWTAERSCGPYGPITVKEEIRGLHGP